MGLPLISAGLNLAAGLASGIVAKSAHNKYAKSLQGLTMDIPKGVLNAEGIYENLASQGLVGYGQKREDVRSTLPSAVSAYKDIVDNPAALLQATQTTAQSVNKSLTDLAVQDAMAKVNNLSNLAQFEGSTKAGWEGQVQDFNNQKTMAIAKEKMLGTTELLQGITGGLSGGVSSYFAGKGLDSQVKLNEAISGAYGNSTGVNITPEQLAAIMQMVKSQTNMIIK